MIGVRNMICETCGHVFTNELVDVYQYGHGDNSREYAACPECGHMQGVLPIEVRVTSSGEMSHV
jgi:rubredoxin